MSRDSRRRRNQEAWANGFDPGIMTIRDFIRLSQAQDALEKARETGDPQAAHLATAFAEIYRAIHDRLKNERDGQPS